MARQVLPIVGAVVGAFFGAPQIGYMIGSIIGNAVDPQVIKGPKLGEAGLQTSAEGVFRPVVLGTAAVKGNVIERGNRRVIIKRTSQGKGGGPVTEEQRVYWTFAIRIAEGPIGGILRIWQDEKLVYDVRPESTIISESQDYADRFRLYLGDETQLPDPDIETYRGVGNTPAFRGTAYIVFPNFDLTDRRESIPDFRFEVSSFPVETGATWFQATEYVGDGAPLKSIQTMDMTGGGMVIVSRTDAPEVPMVYYSTGGAVMEFQNADPLDLHNPIPSTATFGSSSVALPMNTSGGQYAAQVYQVSPGNFHISTYTGDGFAGLTVPHGLGSVPKMHFVRPLDDDQYSISYAHLQQFNGLSFYLFNAGNGLDTSNQEWNNTAPSSSVVTLGNHPQINSAGKMYALFAFGGPDVVVGTGDTATAPDVDFTFNPRGVILKRRSLSDAFDWGFFSPYDEFTFDGIETEAIMSSDVPVTPAERITPTASPTVFTIDNGGSWNNKAFDYFAIRGISTPEDSLTLADIVQWNHDRIGSSTYDVSELTNAVRGIVFAGDYTAADAIRTLMGPYFFDASEYDSGSGYTIHYPKRGKPVVLTINEDDILDLPDTARRNDPLERPKTLHLHYENPTVGYAPAKATSRRDSPDAKVVGERSLQVPVSIQDVDEAAQMSNKLLRVVWAEVDGEEEFTVHDGFLNLVPSDCIGVSIRGQTRRMRINVSSLSEGQIALRLIHDRQSAYTSNVTGVPVPEPTPPLPSVVGDTVFEFMDLPALNDNDDRLIWYEAASGQTPAWYGAQTQRKAGADIEFEDSVTFNRRTIMGTLMNTVADASEHFTDTTNVVTVQLLMDDAIDSLTQEQFLSEGGAFAIERPDQSWEVMQYRDADEISPQTFTLSYLARGRLNTDTSSHAPGARFVLLDAVRSSSAITAWINSDITMRAISFGQSPDEAVQTDHAYTAKSQTEFPVANILPELEGSILTVRVVPRHRFGTEDNPVQSVNWIGYRWVVTDGVNVINRDGTSATQPFDVTGWGSPITITVSQLNRFTGAGPSVSEVFP